MTQLVTNQSLQPRSVQILSKVPVMLDSLLILQFCSNKLEQTNKMGFLRV